MTRQLNPQIWIQLQDLKISGEKIVAKLAFPEETQRIYCAFDSIGRRHLLIPLEKNDEEITDLKSRGITVQTRDLTVGGKESVKYFDVECRDVSGFVIFDQIIAELAESLITRRKQPSNEILRILEKWRRFWANIPAQILTRQEQIGLFSELWFLTNWLIPTLGLESVDGWRGPSGAAKDFIFPDYDVEVKGTISSHGRIHHINSLDQLTQTENKNLYLFSLCLQDDSGIGITLPDLISLCREKLGGNYLQITYFENGLAQVGYSPLHEEEYRNIILEVLSEAVFVVNNEFPAITVGSFSPELSKGVEKVEYDINLNSFEKLIVAKSPLEFNNIVK